MIDLITSSKIGEFLLGVLAVISTVFAFVFSTRNTARSAKEQSEKNEKKIDEIEKSVNNLTTDVAVIKQQTSSIGQIQEDVKKILTNNVK